MSLRTIRSVEELTTESELNIALSAAIRAGHPEKGILAYRSFPGEIKTAATFLLALRAATDSGATLTFVDRVMENVRESAGYQELRLNVQRQLALYYAVVQRHRNLAVAIIGKVKEVRPEEDPEKFGDDLAQGMILLYGGNRTLALHHLHQLYSRRDVIDPLSQVGLDVVFLTFVTAALCGHDDLARDIARSSLRNKHEISEERLRLYKLASRRFRRLRDVRYEAVERYKL